MTNMLVVVSLSLPPGVFFASSADGIGLCRNLTSVLGTLRVMFDREYCIGDY